MFLCFVSNLLCHWNTATKLSHYDDVIMGVMASRITSLTNVYSTVYSSADQRKHRSSASLAFVWGIHRGPVNSPHKWPKKQKMFAFDDVIMSTSHFTAGASLISRSIEFRIEYYKRQRQYKVQKYWPNIRCYCVLCVACTFLVEYSVELK